MKNTLVILCIILMTACNLNSEIKKTKTDFLNEIQGTWTVSEIQNITKAALKNYPRTPFIKFEAEKVGGNNGCNNYFSSIASIDEKTIQFSVFGETKMMCQDMQIPDTFGLLLSKVNSYSVLENTLSFFDVEGEKILVFSKE